MDGDLPARRYYVEIGSFDDLVAFHGTRGRPGVPAGVETVSGVVSDQPHDAIAGMMAYQRSGENAWVVVWTDTYGRGRARNILAIAGSEWRDDSDEAKWRERELLRALMSAEDAAARKEQEPPPRRERKKAPLLSAQLRDVAAAPMAYEAVARWRSGRGSSDPRGTSRRHDADPDRSTEPASVSDATGSRTTSSPGASADEPMAANIDRITHGAPHPSNAADLRSVWAAVTKTLLADILSPRLAAYLPLAHLWAIIDDVALFDVPEAVVRDVIESHLRPAIVEALSRYLGRPMQVAVVLRPHRERRPS